jgi:hypothetical protein
MAIRRGGSERLRGMAISRGGWRMRSAYSTLAASIRGGRPNTRSRLGRPMQQPCRLDSLVAPFAFFF